MTIDYNFRSATSATPWRTASLKSKIVEARCHFQAINSLIRIKKQMQIRIHTPSVFEHGRTMGGRCQNCRAPTPTSGGHGATQRIIAGDCPRRNRCRDEITTSRSSQAGPKWRRGSHVRVSRWQAGPSSQLQHSGPRTRRVSVACSDSDLSRQSGQMATQGGERRGGTTSSDFTSLQLWSYNYISYVENWNRLATKFIGVLINCLINFINFFFFFLQPFTFFKTFNIHTS